MTQVEIDEDVTMTNDERREDAAQRALLVRVAEAAADRAIIKFVSASTPHDGTTHQGMTEFRRDMFHANKVRGICERVKDGALKTTVGAVMLGILAAVWNYIQAVKP